MGANSNMAMAVDTPLRQLHPSKILKDTTAPTLNKVCPDLVKFLMKQLLTALQNLNTRNSRLHPKATLPNAMALFLSMS